MPNSSVNAIDLCATNVSQPPKYDYALEAIRGVAAILVVLEHCVSNGPNLDPNYRLGGLWQYSAPGHLCVLIFFMLSGYVIGVSNAKPVNNAKSVKLYLKKRFVRLYPLYLITIVFTVLVAALYHTPYGVKIISSYLFFLQGIAAPVPSYNQPIWSLSYEILYYIIFIAVSRKQWNPNWVALSFLLLGISIVLLKFPLIILASYSYGAVFWFIGLSLSRIPKSNEPIRYGTMLAFLVLMLSFQRMNLFLSFLATLHIDLSAEFFPNFFDRAISFSDFSLLVYCVPVILCFTNRNVIGQRLLELLAFVIPGLYLGAYIISGKIFHSALFNTLFINMVFYFLALVIYLFRNVSSEIGRKIIFLLMPLGKISYGIYIIHYPLIFLFQRVTWFSGTGGGFLVRLFLYFTVVIILARLLEIHFQPWIRGKMFKQA